MLSILIPIYQQDATKLVQQLLDQCEAAGIEYLISVYDDKSTKKWKQINAPLHHIFKVNYVELSENLGRAKIRNWLAAAAPHENLLFLDGDSGIIADDFIAKYVEVAGKYDVVSGGRTYSKKPCRSKKRRLHWKYGRHIESQPASVRNKQPALYFHSNNFMIKAPVFEKVKFDEEHTGYGYEDILFGESLIKQGYKIYHIDNNTLHAGLERTEDFLQKTKEAVGNLVHLQQSKQMGPTKLSATYHRLERYRLSGLIPTLYKMLQPRIDRSLYEPDPSLKLFQLQKLYWFHLFYKQNHG